MRDTTRTPVPAPSDVPIVTVDTSRRYRHVVSFGAKPAGALGCEVWAKVGGDAPGDEKTAKFLALDTASPYVVDWEPAFAGQTAHYLLR